MNQSDTETEPNYVTCPCQHCGGNIEFDANQLDTTKIPTVPCPHCELQTTIFVPDQKISPIPSSQPSIHPFQTEEDYAEGMKWCFKGAKLGDVQSMSFLGASYLEGVGVPKNYPEAVKWLRLAADRGDIIAKGNLGVCHYHGHAVAQNFSEAEKLFRIAAEHGDATAQYHLGCIYYLGQGLPQNFLEGFSWWLKAAEQGHAEAQNNVGCIYSQGEIIEQDYVEAHKWMSLSAAQGFKDADPADIASKMSVAQLEESRHRIAAFKPKNVKPQDSYNDRLIARLAKLGDLESQAIEMSKTNPLAARDLWLKAVEQNGISNSCVPGGEETVTSWIEEKKLESEIRKLTEAESNQTRRAISSEVRREVWRRDEGKCAKCGSRERLEYDHMIPVSKGGSNTARNIELLCESCNRTKSASIQ